MILLMNASKMECNILQVDPEYARLFCLDVIYTKSV